MKPTAPVVTLLVGAGLATVLFAMSANANREDKADQVVSGGQTSLVPTPSATTGATGATTTTTRAEAEASPSVSEPASSSTTAVAAPAALKPNVTWAGRVGAAKASIAISARNGGAVAYFCDGKKIEGWFLGTAADGELDLTGSTGDRIAGTFGNGRAKGTVTVGGKSWQFDVAAVKKPSGLYRASAKVRGAKVVGGWVVLADGSQVGVITRGDVTSPAPPINVATGAVSVDGDALKAAQVDGSIPPGS